MSEESVLLRASEPVSVPKPGVRTLDISQMVSISPQRGAANGKDVSKSVYRQQVEIETRLERFCTTEAELRYPPAASLVTNGEVLPHIVLRNATWPWERTAGGGQPWLALLAFPSDKHPQAVSGTVSDLRLAPPGAGNRPCLSEDVAAWEKDRPCRYLDLPWELFARIAPQLDEIRMLTHVQQTHTGATHGPMTSVVLSRLPLRVAVPAVDPPGPQRVDVHLVSLEGLAEILPTAHGRPGTRTVTAVRLLTLDQWSFHYQAGNSEAGSEEFARLFTEEVKAKHLGGPESGGALQRQGFACFEQATKKLYYRGPLLSGADLAYRHGAVRDEAYELQDGVDVSLPVAWQMGRLSAMGDPALGPEFARLRQQWKLAGAVNQKGFLDGERVTVAAPGPSTLELEGRLGRRLARLWLLEGVPLHYLVPDASMLAPETICFVHLDRAWADAWMAGAFSAGQHTTKDYTLESNEAQAMQKASGLFAWRGAGIMGVLLRSRAVAIWPGMFVNALFAKQKVNEIRRERIAGDLLLVFFEGQIDTVEFHLAADSQSYRVGSGETSALRADLTDSAAVAKARAEATSRVIFTYEKEKR